ncbi:hypothetical protein Ciccas_013558 [Cichlidogyrus casuarinus]|uniref:Uncharacterized protein n=1 Tax=Cichlidogyrus casuarinus TaxID=1844966 RepID=A0ABD2PML1_9PLAT
MYRAFFCLWLFISVHSHALFPDLRSKFYEAGLKLARRSNCRTLKKLPIEQCREILYQMQHDIFTLYIPDSRNKAESHPDLYLVKHVEIKSAEYRVPSVFHNEHTVSPEESHHFLFALDPWAERAFGHFLFIFYVDPGFDRETCEQGDGGLLTGMFMNQMLSLLCTYQLVFQLIVPLKDQRNSSNRASHGKLH